MFVAYVVRPPQFGIFHRKVRGHIAGRSDGTGGYKFSAGRKQRNLCGSALCGSKFALRRHVQSDGGFISVLYMLLLCADVGNARAVPRFQHYIRTDSDRWNKRAPVPAEMTAGLANMRNSVHAVAVARHLVFFLHLAQKLRGRAEIYLQKRIFAHLARNVGFERYEIVIVGSYFFSVQIYVRQSVQTFAVQADFLFALHLFGQGNPARIYEIFVRHPRRLAFVVLFVRVGNQPEREQIFILAAGYAGRIALFGAFFAKLPIIVQKFRYHSYIISVLHISFNGN